MTDADPATPRQAGGESPEILRAKYHDYCSAQLADLLLYLTPDEMFVLAQKAAQEDLGGPGQLSYARMVALATDWLANKVHLPPFEVWAQDYEAHPQDYEDYFMGLWESALPPRVDG